MFLLIRFIFFSANTHRYYKRFIESAADRLGLGGRVLNVEEESPIGWKRVVDAATTKEYFFNSTEHEGGGVGCLWHGKVTPAPPST